ncbi:MAG: response regulator [Betaproteobacteria bacterium]|nr:response regulator [Betaproteobacteria bacterium]MBV9361553.1 response regulator [Betaproteobacteria bacterium]
MEEKANILVVDDLPEKLLVFTSILEELGQNLVTVRSGGEALKEVLAREFAVILLDVNMPDIDGLETGRLIRQYKKSAHTPIIFITAYADEMQTAQGYSLGAVDYILSPVRPDVLRSKVKVFVELYQMQQRTRAMAEAEVARASAEEARRRANFLAHASHELGASLDLEQGMRRLLDLVVPHVCDAAAVTVEKEPGKLDTASAPASDFAPAPLKSAMQVVMRDHEVLEIPDEAGLATTLCYPLQVGDRVIGAFALGYTGRQPRDRDMLEEVAGRAAIALDNARLYRTLKREITRSKQAEENLQDANRRKDEFLAMLSHELRNPLAPIRNAVELMRRVGSTEQRLVMSRDVIDRQVTQLTRLVDELLDVSRISQGKIQLKKEPVELAKIIAHSVETARPMIDQRDQRLSLEVSARPVWLQGDFARLSQAVSNLLNNASKYTPEGGRIRLIASANEGVATITVEDNGSGIEPELLPKIFELFVQGERGLDRAQGGLGIGLTLVKRLVELHQGQVEAHSDGIGNGARFKIMLPSISAVRQPELAAAPPSALAGQEIYGRRVLVVDDNVDAAESTAAFLRLEGHEVKTVSDGAEALASVRVFAPHVVVLDIGLPGLDGYAVARRLRDQGDTSHALLIAMTGYGQKDDRQKATDAGFDYFFVKPTDPTQLQHAIERGRPHHESASSHTKSS